MSALVVLSVVMNHSYAVVNFFNCLNITLELVLFVDIMFSVE